MGATPLSWAAWNGHEVVVKTLLGRSDVDPNKADHDGRTPLWRAALAWHEGVVKLLLGRDDVIRDRPDLSGRTPLSWAALKGHEGVVKLLLACDDVDPNNLDDKERTPLYSGGLPAVDTREWWKYYSDEATLTPTGLMSTGKHHSGERLSAGMREW